MLLRDWPPSTVQHAPVTRLARSDARHATPSTALPAIHRADENNPAARLTAHEGHRRARRSQTGEDIHVQAADELRVRSREPGAAAAARIVHQDLQAAEA